MSDLDGVEAFIRLRRLELTLVAKLDAGPEGRGVRFAALESPPDRAGARSETTFVRRR